MNRAGRILAALIAATAALLAPLALAGDLEDGIAAYLDKDYAKALELWRPLADKGVPAAQYQMGMLYAEGKGVEQNDQTAATWFLRGAERGNALAQYNLAVSYAEGLGIRKDDAEAVKWFRRAANQGMPFAQLNLGLLYATNRVEPPDNIEAVKWLELAIFAVPPGGARSDAARALKDVADKMTEEQILEARTRQRQFRAKPEALPPAAK